MPDLKHQIPIEASPARVYAAVATSEGNRGWWTADSTVESKAGGQALFGFEKRAAVFRMTVDALSPDRELVMSCHAGPPEWTGTRLIWSLVPDGRHTILKFTHAGWKEMTDYCASCNSMWGRLMYRIKDYAETGRASPQWTE
jgi:uncharacterized protein YndB with AHSA1/START domain